MSVDDMIGYMNNLYDTENNKYKDVKILYKNITRFLLGYVINANENIFKNATKIYDNAS